MGAASSHTQVTFNLLPSEVCEDCGVLTQPKLRYDFLQAASATLPRTIFDIVFKQQKALENVALSRA
jgi:hypothetical protein